MVTILHNRGKAHAFNVALAFAKGDFILSNDADTKPNPDALWQYMSYFEREGGHNVGAVTGNMLAANRTTLTAQAQQNELNSIIGLIKRSQMSYGALFAFSGANTMYRKQAVLDVGGWHAEQPTEDISNAWDMQTAGWRALFAPHIRFFLDVPEQTRALIKQRRRWSGGGVYVLASKGPALVRHPITNYRMMPVILGLLGEHRLELPLLDRAGAVHHHAGRAVAIQQDWDRFWHNWYMVGIFVAIQMVVGVLQLTAASFYNDGGRTLKYVVFAPWYMLVYWMMNTWTVVREFVPGAAQGVAPERRRNLEVAGALRESAGPSRSTRRGIMTDKPSYVVHTVTEKEITVDWFFGKGHLGKKITQFFLLLCRMVLRRILPMVVTASAILNRDNPDKGWWKYAEGFTLVGHDDRVPQAFFLILFVVGYLVLFLVNRASREVPQRDGDLRRGSAGQEARDRRGDLYEEKFGPLGAARATSAT